ncbi:MAG: hypothetical protein NTAFB01_13700 [Nitrospira sp.]
MHETRAAARKRKAYVLVIAECGKKYRRRSDPSQRSFIEMIDDFQINWPRDFTDTGLQLRDCSRWHHS